MMDSRLCVWDNPQLVTMQYNAFIVGSISALCALVQLAITNLGAQATFFFFEIKLPSRHACKYAIAHTLHEGNVWLYLF